MVLTISILIYVYLKMDGINCNDTYIRSSFYKTCFINDICIIFFSVALRPNADHSLLILEVSRSHTTTHHSR
jgi:hypothetical protein